MQSPAASPEPGQTSRAILLPWPCLSQGRTLFVLAAATGGRSQSLGRFFGASFLAFGLLLLLIGFQKSLSPALAAGFACIFSGLVLLGAVRSGQAPLLILDMDNMRAVLCRRRLGRRAFRIFPLEALEISADANGRSVQVRPKGNGEAGREIPGLPSGISDSQWRKGMTLAAGSDNAQVAAAALQLWLLLAREGEAPLLVEALDADEVRALLGKSLPSALLQGLSGLSWTDFQALDAAQERQDAPERPEIRRAPDLRNSSANRDKRA